MSTKVKPGGAASGYRFDEVLASTSEILRQQFQAAKSLKHRGLRGTARELALVQTFLREHFPAQFGFVTGEVVGVSGSVSGQQDVIVYHASRSPVLYRNENIQVVPVESVLAVVEVKSTLDKKELKSAVDQIRSAKSLVKSAYYPQHLGLSGQSASLGEGRAPDKTLGYVFAYKSIKLDRIHQYLTDWGAQDDVDGVFVLAGGCLLHRNVGEETVLSGAGGASRLSADSSSMPLLQFYLLLWSHLIKAWTLPIRLTDYLGKHIPSAPNPTSRNEQNGGD